MNINRLKTIAIAAACSLPSTLPAGRVLLPTETRVHNETNPFLKLPLELHLEILGWLKTKDRVTVSEACCQLNAAAIQNAKLDLDLSLTNLSRMAEGSRWFENPKSLRLKAVTAASLQAFNQTYALKHFRNLRQIELDRGSLREIEGIEETLASCAKSMERKRVETLVLQVANQGIQELDRIGSWAEDVAVLELEVKKSSFAGNESFATFDWGNLFGRFPKLQEIHADFDGVSIPELEVFCASCGNRLRRLNLVAGSEFFSTFNWTSLEEEFFDPDSLIQSVPALQEYRASFGNEFISSRCVRSLIDALKGKLKGLQVTIGIGGSHFPTHDTIVALLQNCQQLEDLNLKFVGLLGLCRNPDNAGQEVIIPPLAHLTTLKLAPAEGETDPILPALVERSPNLASLTVEDSCDVRAFVTAIRSCPKLAQLDLSGGKQSAAEAFQDVEQPFPDITSLTLRNWNLLTDEDLPMIVRLFPNLVQLDLRGCEQLAEAGVRAIARPGLKILRGE